MHRNEGVAKRKPISVADLSKYSPFDLQIRKSFVMATATKQTEQSMDEND